MHFISFSRHPVICFVQFVHLIQIDFHHVKTQIAAWYFQKRARPWRNSSNAILYFAICHHHYLRLISSRLLIFPAPPAHSFQLAAQRTVTWTTDPNLLSFQEPIVHPRAHLSNAAPCCKATLGVIKPNAVRNKEVCCRVCTSDLAAASTPPGLPAS